MIFSSLASGPPSAAFARPSGVKWNLETIIKMCEQKLCNGQTNRQIIISYMVNGQTNRQTHKIANGQTNRQIVISYIVNGQTNRQT